MAQVNDETSIPDGDLTDLLGELRVLLPGAQTLTAFLIILPFNSGFATINGTEKVVYAITFICSLISLILFTAPAAQHRLQRPLRRREEFKEEATRLIVLGMIPLSIALILACQLVLSNVIGTQWVSWAVAGSFAVMIAIFWWLMPVARRRRLAQEQKQEQDQAPEAGTHRRNDAPRAGHESRVHAPADR